MPRGGARLGSGRKPGVRNKRTQQLCAEVAASGETPLEYMLRIMRDDRADAKRRDEMAKAAAPYLHPRLQRTEQFVETVEPVAPSDVREKITRLLNRLASTAATTDAA